MDVGNSGTTSMIINEMPATEVDNEMPGTDLNNGKPVNTDDMESNEDRHIVNGESYASRAARTV